MEKNSEDGNKYIHPHKRKGTSCSGLKNEV